MKKILFLFLLWICCGYCFSQESRAFLNLQNYLQKNKPPGLDSTLTILTNFPKGNLNYLYPLFQLIHEENQFRALYSPADYNDQMSLAIASAGDYETALDFQKKNYGPAPDEVAKRQVAKVIAGYKDVQHVDARRYISFISRNYSVIMINEAQNKPIHRAFVVTLLGDLYKRGFRYLAMEMLNNFANHELEKLTPLTGQQCSETVAGELIRTALDIGYKLVSYEDTFANVHSASQRDSIQATNLFRVIREDSNARILVLAGYAHIAEKNGGAAYVPMAMAFKRISGIDPLTIDQTDMTEESNFAYGKYFYDTYTQKYSLTSPSIALIKEQPVNVTSSDLYDLSIIHPPTTYRDSRPIWLSLGGRRQPLYIKPQDKNTFLVQAYYQFESFGAKPPQVIPADQTYIPNNKGNYLLYLKRGKYILLFRDMNYHILKTQHIEVN